MSEAVIFEIGAVIFAFVTTAVFLYGRAVFVDLEERDEARQHVAVPFEMTRITDVSTAGSADGTGEHDNEFEARFEGASRSLDAA